MRALEGEIAHEQDHITHESKQHGQSQMQQWSHGQDQEGPHQRRIDYRALVHITKGQHIQRFSQHIQKI